ncbi:MAG TPA: pyrimidine reductase family protein [Mycobacteriales bacterium]|nr:pyrimidine reductase family protein [Mycobacteriales bacterium]
MRRLVPDASEVVDLRAAYAVPDSRHVRVNFAASVDGAVTVDGRSRGLSSDADRELFHVLRAMSDVVLVGAGTARAENYGGARQGDHTTPPVAVVSRSLDLDPASRLFTDTRVPPIVLTCAAAPVDRRTVLRDIADVIDVGDDVVDVTRALDALADRGLRRVICEGGPHLFGWLAAAAVVDELCLTVAPLIAGGAAGRIVAGLATQVTDPLRLVHVLEEDGHLFLRYAAHAAH